MSDLEKKVILINRPIIQVKDLDSISLKWQLTDLTDIVARLEEKNIQCKIIDVRTSNLTIDQVTEEIKHFQPDLILYSVESTDFYQCIHPDWQPIIDTIGSIKKATNAKILFFAAQLAYFDKELMKQLPVDLTVKSDDPKVLAKSALNILNHRLIIKKGVIKKTIKKILRPFVPQFVLDFRKTQFGRKEFEEWQKNGCTIPPPHIVKQVTIAEYQKKSGYSVLVETGTFRGKMIEAQKKRFKKVISIELDNDLFVKAQKRFSHDKNVTIVHGDSGKVLLEILKDIDEPIIFWLDGHYSGGITAKGDKNSPIFEEVDAIMSAKKFNHILLIDDARCFLGDGDYPTVDELTKYIRSKNEKYQVEVKNDIIRYVV